MNNFQKLTLTSVPVGSRARSVDVASVDRKGRECVSVTFDARTANGLPDIDYVDMPTFLEVPIEFGTGKISVDVLSDLRDDAPEYARGFAGVAYRVTEESFEAVYLRPLNGIRLQPAPPRSERAIQYFSYPDWRFAKLRDDYPDGRFEARADIQPGMWTNLTLDVSDESVSVTVDGVPSLVIDAPKRTAQTGKLGLFVDIGTLAYFSNLEVWPIST